MNFFATVGKKGVVLLEKPSLVLEGGTFRPIFSSGAMDALLDHDVTFPYCVGVLPVSVTEYPIFQNNGEET